MRLITILTLPGATLREKAHRIGDLVLIKVAHGLPRGLAYRSFIDTGVRYTHDHPDAEVPAIRYLDIVEHAGEQAARP